MEGLIVFEPPEGLGKMGDMGNVNKKTPYANTVPKMHKIFSHFFYLQLPIPNVESRYKKERMK